VLVTVRERRGRLSEQAMERTDVIRLLVVDDEPVVRELLSAGLRFAGFAVTSAATGAAAVTAAVREPPDLIVLDVMLPDLDGFEVVRRLRGHGPRAGGPSPPVPVLFLTARDATQDKIDGLAAGGDDYVTKPFSVEELIARIHAVLRRTAGRDDDTLTVADLVLERGGRQVRRSGRPIRLSPTEFRLLLCLMDNADRVLSKAQILEHVWRYDFGGDASIVETYISYLRRKIDTAGPKLIHTVWGTGYVLRTPGRRAG
jgi:two-component system OmpR family response regulator